MIVCICHGVCERRLEALAEAGADCLEKMERACGAGGDCGSCREEIEQIISRKRLIPPPCAPAEYRVQARERS